MALGRLPEMHMLNNGGMVGYFEDEHNPLHHIGVKWILEEALVRLDRFPGAEYPQSLLVSCIPVRNPVANGKCSGRWPSGDVVLSPLCTT